MAKLIVGTKRTQPEQSAQPGHHAHHPTKGEKIMDESRVEELLSEKLMDGFLLLDRACPQCLTPLVKQEQALRSPKTMQVMLTPIPGVPYCVSCQAHVMNDERHIVRLQKHYHGQELQGNILIDLEKDEKGALLDDTTVGTEASSQNESEGDNHAETHAPRGLNIQIADAEEIELICSKISGDEESTKLTTSMSDNESVAASVMEGLNNNNEMALNTETNESTMVVGRSSTEDESPTPRSNLSDARILNSHAEQTLTARDEHWPSFEERKLIATKVLSVKMLQGHRLLQKQCRKCSMPLTEQQGETDCVVCPVLHWRILKAREKEQQKQLLKENRIEAQRSAVQKNKNMLLESAKTHPSFSSLAAIADIPENTSSTGLDPPSADEEEAAASTKKSGVEHFEGGEGEEAKQQPEAETEPIVQPEEGTEPIVQPICETLVVQANPDPVVIEEGSHLYVGPVADMASGIESHDPAQPHSAGVIDDIEKGSNYPSGPANDGSSEPANAEDKDSQMAQEFGEVQNQKVSKSLLTCTGSTGSLLSRSATRQGDFPKRIMGAHGTSVTQIAKPFLKKNAFKESVAEMRKNRADEQTNGSTKGRANRPVIGIVKVTLQPDLKGDEATKNLGDVMDNEHNDNHPSLLSNSTISTKTKTDNKAIDHKERVETVTDENAAGQANEAVDDAALSLDPQENEPMASELLLSSFEHKKKVASNVIESKMSEGWIVLNSPCPTCAMPLMVDASGQNETCAYCSLSSAREEDTHDIPKQQSVDPEAPSSYESMTMATFATPHEAVEEPPNKPVEDPAPATKVKSETNRNNVRGMWSAISKRRMTRVAREHTSKQNDPPAVQGYTLRRRNAKDCDQSVAVVQKSPSQPEHISETSQEQDPVDNTNKQDPLASSEELIEQKRILYPSENLDEQSSGLDAPIESDNFSRQKALDVDDAPIESDTISRPKTRGPSPESLGVDSIAARSTIAVDARVENGSNFHLPSPLSAAAVKHAPEEAKKFTLGIPQGFDVYNEEAVRNLIAVAQNDVSLSVDTDVDTEEEAHHAGGVASPGMSEVAIPAHYSVKRAPNLTPEGIGRFGFSRKAMFSSNNPPKSDLPSSAWHDSQVDSHLSQDGMVSKAADRSEVSVGSSYVTPIVITSQSSRERRELKKNYQVQSGSRSSASPETIIILEEDELSRVAGDSTTGHESVGSEAIDNLLSKIEKTQAQLAAAADQEDSIETRERLAELLDQLSAAAAAVEQLDDDNYTSQTDESTTQH